MSWYLKTYTTLIQYLHFSFPLVLHECVIMISFYKHVDFVPGLQNIKDIVSKTFRVTFTNIFNIFIFWFLHIFLHSMKYDMKKSDH